VRAPKAETAVSLSETVLQGEVTLIPQIISRNELVSVNYYLDGAQVAVHTAGQSPWAFSWDTAGMTPGTHTLLVEAVDNAEPPHVGVYETAVQIAACGILCRGEQMLGFNPLFLLGALLVISVTLAALLWNRRFGRLQQKPVPSPPPQPHPVPLSAMDPPLRESEREGAEPSPPPATAATVQMEEDDKSEGAGPDGERTASLLDRQNQRRRRLESVTQIGAAVDNDIVLDDPTTPAHCAIVRLESGRYVLQTTAGDNVRVNGEPVSGQIVLQERDQIQIGTRLFVFEAVE
jgi:pSer/pThr/pTyr-binding forkhead associated (FHA) protein